MFNSRIVRTISLILGLGILLIAFVARLQAWQVQTVEQTGNVNTIALSSENTTFPSATEIATELIATHTPFPLPMAVNEQGTPFNPFELTPILTIPVVNAEGTPLTPTPNQEELAGFAGTPRPMPTLTPGGPATPTPPSFATRVDLAEGLPDSEVWRIVILRTDGNLDEYRIPAEEVRPLIADSTNIDEYLAFRNTLFQLAPGEIVIYENFVNALVKAVPPADSKTEKTEQPATPMLESTDRAVLPEQSTPQSELHLPEIAN